MFVGQVFGVPLDFMHTVGGGDSIASLEFLLRLHASFPAGAAFGNRFYETVDRHFTEWSKRTPKELARRVRNFTTDRKEYKMIEAQEVTFYHSIALLAVDGIRNEIIAKFEPDSEEVADGSNGGIVFVEAYMSFVYAMHLIGQSTHAAPSARDIKKADKLLRFFVATFLTLSPRFLSYKMHCLIHFANEARVFQSHLGGFDAYDYENFLGRFRDRTLIRNGREVLKQVYNRLTQAAAHALPKANGKVLKVIPTVAAEAEAVKAFGSMDLPSNTVLSDKLQQKKKSVKCEGFTVTTR